MSAIADGDLMLFLPGNRLLLYTDLKQPCQKDKSFQREHCFKSYSQDVLNKTQYVCCFVWLQKMLSQQILKLYETFILINLRDSGISAQKLRKWYKKNLQI
jgi:hypothetical protein